jgi:tRNA (guanine-N7-)-methyltransferase
VDAGFAAEAGRVLSAGGRLRFVTDWASYADQALAVFTGAPAFAWTARRADDWRLAPGDHVATRYEGKALGDCAPIWLEFERT